MPANCLVLGCTNVKNRDNAMFFRIPSALNEARFEDPDRRERDLKWLAAILQDLVIEPLKRQDMFRPLCYR